MVHNKVVVADKALIVVGVLLLVVLLVEILVRGVEVVAHPDAVHYV